MLIQMSDLISAESGNVSLVVFPQHLLRVKKYKRAEAELRWVTWIARWYWSGISSQLLHDQKVEFCCLLFQITTIKLERSAGTLKMSIVLPLTLMKVDEAKASAWKAKGCSRPRRKYS
jgi:hypothetical protein